MRKFFKDFKAFISKGNVLALAIAVIMGTAFSAIVTALVNSILMPLICAIFGKTDVSSLSFILNNSEIKYGVFLQAVIDFLLIATVLFITLKIAMSAHGFSKKLIKNTPNKAERKELKAMGVNMKNLKEVIAATEALRESKKPKEEKKPTTDELLTDILGELKKINEENDEKSKK